MDHLIDDNDRLKPCPFCGGEATFDHDDNGWNWIECLACGASTNARVSAMDDCKPLLIEQWNKRVPPACGSWLSLDAQRNTGGQAMTALDSTHTTAVDHGYHWQPMTSCPKGSKVQLLTRYGCAIYGTWTGKDTIYTGWAPLPTRAPEGAE